MEKVKEIIENVLDEYVHNVNEQDSITEQLELAIETIKNGTPFILPPIYSGKGTFGEATFHAKNGRKVARVGWNGAGMYAYIVPEASYPAQTEVAKKQFGDMVPYRAYWALKTAQNDVATWAPSGSDSLAEDWSLVD